MRLWLASHVYGVTIGSDIVLLDVAADTYLCLAEAAQYIRLEADGAVNVDPDEAGEDLLEAGLLGRSPTTARHAAPPIARGTEGALARPTLGAAKIALATNTRVARAMAHAPFQDVLVMAGPLGEDAFTEPSTDLMTASARFARMAPWLPRDGLCLMRSLQQRLYLAEQGFSAAWVFGVRTWPFEAHCWLQAGEVVLDDTPEHAGDFTPILVV